MYMLSVRGSVLYPTRAKGEVVDSNCDVIVVLPKIKLKTSVPPYIKNNVLSPQCRG